MGRKFNVGDRVVYEAACFGNHELDGRHGVVVKVDSTMCPYTVAFDDEYAFSVRDERVSGKYRDRTWWCREENLTLEREYNNKEKGEDTMGKMVWTAEKVERLKELMRAGRTSQEMAAVFGCSVEVIWNKCYKLRREDATLPQGYTKRSKPAEPEDEQRAEPKLGELEEQMAEVITELQGELDDKEGKIKVLEDKIAELYGVIKAQEDELTAARTAVGEVERARAEDELWNERLDNANRAIDVLEADNRRYLELIAALAGKIVW